MVSQVLISRLWDPFGRLGCEIANMNRDASDAFNTDKCFLFAMMIFFRILFILKLPDSLWLWEHFSKDPNGRPVHNTLSTHHSSIRTD